MKLARLQIAAAILVILSAAVAAEAMIPRTSMARGADSLNLGKLIPASFDQWRAVPGVRLIEPPGSDTLSREIYNQELARGYADSEGHVIMLLVAYGASQSDRLQLHRPEICYTAQGFHVSGLVKTALEYRKDKPPLRLTRLITQREGRLEPVSYWMRIGDDVATGVVERQILKVKYGLRGLIPDGAVVRISTTGLPEKQAFQLEDEFVKDLLTFVDPAANVFLIGDPSRAKG